jgi:hypothetical protein
MMGRGQLTKIAATVADEVANRPAGWELISANRSIGSMRSNGVVMPPFMVAMSSMELTDAELHRLFADSAHRPREARARPVAKRHKAKPIAAGHSTGSHHRRNLAPRTNLLTCVRSPDRSHPPLGQTLGNICQNHRNFAETPD